MPLLYACYKQKCMKRTPPTMHSTKARIPQCSGQLPSPATLPPQFMPTHILTRTAQVPQSTRLASHISSARHTMKHATRLSRQTANPLRRCQSSQRQGFVTCCPQRSRGGGHSRIRHASKQWQRGWATPPRGLRANTEREVRCNSGRGLDTCRVGDARRVGGLAAGDVLAVALELAGEGAVTAEGALDRLPALQRRLDRHRKLPPVRREAARHHARPATPGPLSTALWQHSEVHHHKQHPRDLTHTHPGTARSTWPQNRSDAQRQKRLVE